MALDTRQVLQSELVARYYRDRGDIRTGYRSEEVTYQWQILVSFDNAVSWTS